MLIWQVAHTLPKRLRDFGFKSVVRRAHNSQLLGLAGVRESTTEAEMISLAEGLFVEALPVQDLLSKVAERVVPLVIHEDNEAVIKVIEAGYSVYSVKLRGLLRTHKLSIASVSDIGKTHKNEVLLRYTNTKEQLADRITKALTRLPFHARLATCLSLQTLRLRRCLRRRRQLQLTSPLVLRFGPESSSCRNSLSL